MFLYKGKVFQEEENEHLIFHKEIVLEEKTPLMEWKGGLIEYDEWNKILTFFRKNAKEEVQCRLYYNSETKEWMAWAMPQIQSGMTVKEIQDSVERTEQLAQFPDPWIYFGTVHHHCDSGAFQSTTDQTDEENIDGLHVTVGKIEDKIVELDTRFAHKGTFYDAELSSFIKLPQALQPYKSLVIHANYIDKEYPEPWDKNIHKPKPVIHNYQTTGHRGYLLETTKEKEEDFFEKDDDEICFWQFVADNSIMRLEDYLIYKEVIGQEYEGQIDLIENRLNHFGEAYAKYKKGEDYEDYLFDM